MYVGNLPRFQVRRAAQRDSVGEALVTPWVQARWMRCEKLGIRVVQRQSAESPDQDSDTALYSSPVNVVKNINKCNTEYQKSVNEGGMFQTRIEKILTIY